MMMMMMMMMIIIIIQQYALVTNVSETWIQVSATINFELNVHATNVVTNT